MTQNVIILYRITGLFIFFLSIFISIGCHSQTLSGKAVSITDGDTFKLLTTDSSLVRVRLASIDCPERKQPFSQRAKQFTLDAIAGKQVTVEQQSTDRNGRIIGIIYYDNGLILNEELLKAGLAWHYLKYSSDVALQSLQDTAKREQLGLWADAHAIPPWEWRKNRRKG
ncbi:thermonuclease family protein [Constantimarinum furrinae]|uniref:Nuclease n=1 Tax=Constantimarinum furrinae TaxID=2562285 RepID=A0A7G8PRQ7_9FLAO|nr:thermonuclease family protein [Constantimarinum furrinae]QNJ97023.1 nuclease [Constantimarinum furrinae]